jgi:glycosyltransferase involved in cell wall biosynthesis
MARLRILHILTMLEIGGAQHNTLFSTRDALRRGHEAWLVSAPGALSSEARALLGNRLIEETALVREVNPLRDASAFTALREHIRRLVPDVVHTHSSKAGVLGRRAAFREQVPMIVHTVHGWGFHDRQAWAIRRAYQMIERAMAGITDRIVVVADANREKGLAAGIGRREQYTTIRSGIEIDAGGLIAGREAVRREIGIPREAFVVASIGNYKPQKAPGAMSRIAREFLERRPDAHFVSAGDGDGKEEVEEILFKNSSISERVHLLGWRSDAPAVLAAADAFLHTALFEGLPRVILEAMALGVPAVSTDVDGIPEAVRDGETGFLFKPGEDAAMADALLRLHDDADLRRAMSEAARSAFGAEFTLRKMLDDLDALYAEIAGEKRSLAPR